MGKEARRKETGGVRESVCERVESVCERVKEWGKRRVEKDRRSEKKRGA